MTTLQILSAGARSTSSIDLMGLTQHNRLSVSGAAPGADPGQLSGLFRAPRAPILSITLWPTPRSSPKSIAHFTAKKWCGCLTVISSPMTGGRSLNARRAGASAGCPRMASYFAASIIPTSWVAETFEVWMRLLKATPGSVLWLSEANVTAQANLRREARTERGCGRTG